MPKPMTHKERVRRALLHQPLDRLPTQIPTTRRMAEKLAAHFDIPPGELDSRLDNHLVRLDLSFSREPGREDRSRLDWWGAGHAVDEEGYFINYSPLAGSKDLDAFSWPDPHEPGLLDEARRLVDAYGREYFILPNFGWALFERAWSLRGFEQLLLDMAEDPGFVAELLDRIVAIQLALIECFLELGVDGGYFGDDYGAQHGLLFSPRMWRGLIKPRLQRLFQPFVGRGLPVVMHSDGAIQPVLPDLVEIGLTTLNPVQPEVLDQRELRRQFGERLSYFGGVSTQTVLPHGAPGEVRKAVGDCVEALAPDCTGLWIGPSHRLMSDIPIPNVEAMLESMRGLTCG